MQHYSPRQKRERTFCVLGTAWNTHHCTRKVVGS